MKPLDAKAAGSMHAGSASFSVGNRVARAWWMLVWAVLASWTPPPLHRWRRFLLQAFGGEIGQGARVYGSVRIWHPRLLRMGEFAWLGPRVNCYNQGLIVIGARAIVSQGTHLCAGTHDTSDPYFQLVTRPITIGADAWVAAEAFVGPGVRVGEGAVLGARAVAFRDLDAWTIYSGNPATRLRERVMRDGRAA